MLTGMSEEIIFRLLRYRNEQFWVTILCALLVVIVFNYARVCARRRGKTLFWLACSLAGIGIAITAGLYWTRLPHGLSGRYFATPAWLDDGTELERFFDTNGQRVDRFIDFHPNDFNNEYPFTWGEMSAHWQGSVYIPEEEYRMTLDTQNVGAWLRVDDVLIEGHHRIDFGTQSARSYLREGWSRDEVWGSGTPFSFVWGLEDRSEFYLGVDEAADYRLVFRCAPFQQQDMPQQEIMVSIAGQHVGSVMLKEGWQTYDLPVPKHIIQESIPGFFRVTFTYAHAVDQSQDPRPLRVAFDFAWLQHVSDVFDQSNARLHSESLLSSHPLSKGLHTVELKVLTDEAKDLRIRLLWHSDNGSPATVIPEDFLFPVGLEFEDIRQAFPGERIWLGISVTANIIICLFLVWLIGWGVLLTIHWRALLRKEWILLGGICLFAFVIRGLFIVELTQIDPFFENFPRGTDQLTYVIYARGFFRGFWPGLFHQPFHGAPLISLYLILCAILFGENLIFARLTTTVLASLTVWFVYKVCRQSFPHSRAIAYVSAILCACNGALIFYDTSLIIAPLLTFLSVVSLYLMGTLRQQYSPKTAILLGIFLGLTALSRSNILLIMPFLGLWMLVAFSGNLFQKARYYVLICLCMAVTIAPVTIRNYYASPEHEFVLTNGNGDIMLWLSNNPTADGKGGFSEELKQETLKRIKRTSGSYSQEVRNYVRSQPLEFLTLLFQKLKFFWQGYEIPNLLQYYIFRYISKLLGLPWMNFVLLAPLGIVGLALAHKQWRTAFILYSYVFIQMATTVIFHALARYRVPVVPVLSIFVAYTLWYLGRMLRAKQWWRAGLVVGMVLVFYVSLNYPYAAELYQQHYGEAMPWFRLFRYWDLFHTW